ncbi:MAG: CoA-binding protein [Pseudomonadota bacterium]
MNFKKMFKPSTMAVVGVSTSVDNHPANVIFNKNNLRYPVKVFPVNPRGGMFQRERLFESIEVIPEAVDLAVIAARAEHVLKIVQQCIKKGVGGAVIISGGFSETGDSKSQESLKQMALEADFPIIGPNCLGIYSPGVVDTFFLPGERIIRPQAGNVGFISQSGGVLVDQMVKFAGQGIGVSMGVSIGNKAVVREIDLLKWLESDPDTAVIAFYVEGFDRREGRKFIKLAEACPKPVIVMKAGKSARGMEAVSSHTASLAGDYTVFSSVLKQHGVVEARSEYEMTAFCEALSCYASPIRGSVGIISVSGGHGVVAADACAAHGLCLPQLSQATASAIREKLSPEIRSIASLRNPVDLTGSARDVDFIAAAEAMSRDPEIDCILILLLPYSPGISADIGARLSHVYQREGKPMIAYVPKEDKYAIIIEGFELNRVPVAASVEDAVLMAEALRRFMPC